MILDTQIQESMERIRELMEDVKGVVGELEQAFDSAELNSKSADCELRKQVNNAIESSRAHK